MIASLPMYARPSNRGAHDRLWGLIRDGLRDRKIKAPQELNHQIDPMEGWASANLVLSQICNLPYRVRFRDRVTMIGASDYGLSGCAPGYYQSVFVVRQDCTARDPADMAKSRLAYNDRLSQSGYGSAQIWAQSRGFLFDPALVTGSHRASLEAVAQGTADIAAIDAQTWWMEQQENPLALKVKVIGQTLQSPGMTFVTRGGEDPAPYFAAIHDAIAALPPDDSRKLGLKGIIALPQTAYDLPLPPKHQAFAT